MTEMRMRSGPLPGTYRQGTVENCVSYAIVYGTSYVGGIIGTRDNAMGNCSVIGCKFYGTVEASGEVAGGTGVAVMTIPQPRTDAR